MNFVDLASRLGVSDMSLNFEISHVKALSEAGGLDRSTLSWISDANLIALDMPLSCTLICSDNARNNPLLKSAILIIVDNPRAAFRVALQLFVETNHDVELSSIADTAHIHPSAIIGDRPTIGHNVVIESNVWLGNDVCIGHNSVIKAGSIIGNRVKIGSNCTIGGVGFGYEKNDDGRYEVLPHIGIVTIEDDVDIGNNTCVDRAVLGSTFLRNNAKVDNLVHISHNCDIGKNSLIIANTMVGGSVKIGENVWIAPSSSILNQRSVADNAMVGMGAVVLKDIPVDDVVVGNPAKSLRGK
jgi:UDP-3-O-[3-hydroxymyristoyl] glucosamine N-acyltransferase